MQLISSFFGGRAASPIALHNPTLKSPAIRPKGAELDRSVGLEYRWDRRFSIRNRRQEKSGNSSWLADRQHPLTRLPPTQIPAAHGIWQLYFSRCEQPRTVRSRAEP